MITIYGYSSVKKTVGKGKRVGLGMDGKYSVCHACFFKTTQIIRCVDV